MSEPQRGFWAELGLRERTELHEAGSWREFRPGMTVLTEHDTTDHVLVIWFGYAKVMTINDAGREVMLALRGPGDLLGELVGIGGGPRSATVTAIEPLRALVVDGTQFLRLMRNSRRGEAALNRVVVGRLREGDRDRSALVFTTVGQRLARLLLKFADTHGIPDGTSGTVLAFELSQRELATFAGGSPRAVARELSVWRKRGFLRTGRRRMVILREDQLRRIAGSKRI